MSKSWAEERLGQWLREYDAGSTNEVLSELREAVEHLAECKGVEVEHGDCPVYDRDDSSQCDCPTSPCQDCKWFREGHEGTWTTVRSVYALMDDLENRLFDMEESAA